MAGAAHPPRGRQHTDPPQARQDEAAKMMEQAKKKQERKTQALRAQASANQEHKNYLQYNNNSGWYRGSGGSYDRSRSRGKWKGAGRKR